jgi:hypothetical protein
MRRSLKMVFVLLLCLVKIEAEAQKSGLFDSFDCRKHEEFIEPEPHFLAEILALDPIIIPSRIGNPGVMYKIIPSEKTVGV